MLLVTYKDGYYKVLKEVVSNLTCAIILLWTDWPSPQDTFCTIFPQVDYLFSLMGQKQVCDTGVEAVMKIHKKIKKKWCTWNRYIFCYNLQSVVDLKLKFWGYNEKNIGFHLTSKKNYFRLHPGDENVIGIRAFKHEISNFQIRQ